jgi:tetratricopeptide (TPR) repeat protein
MELAAARVRSLSVQDINARLKDRYKFLTGGARTLLERQQTLRALVAWSYDLLQENERLLFERLGVFAGGLDVPSAEDVCGTDPLAPDDVLDLLTSLVDKSLVMVDQSHDTTRYRMLVTLREYARERLGERGDLEATAARHCDYFLGLAKIARAELQGPGQAEWTRRLELDLDDVRAGIRLALSGGVDAILAVKFEVALMSFRMLRGHLSEGRKNIRDALAVPAVKESDVAHAHALYVGAALADGQGDNAEALRMLEECLDLRRKLGQPEDTAATLSTLSIARLHAGDAAKAREGEEEAVAIFRELGDRVGEGVGLIHLGEIAIYGGDFARAREHFERCLALARELDSREMAAECERSLGELALEAGELPAARAWLERSLETCREAEDKRNEAAAHWWLGNADLEGGDAEAARAKLNEALRTFRDFEMNPELLGCLEDHARLLHANGATGQAVRLYAMIAACRARLTHTQAPHRERRRQQAIDTARAVLGEGAFDTAWKVPQPCTLASAVTFALEATARTPVAA